MHEMALMRNVVNTVLNFADQYGAIKVRSVYLTVGMNRDVVEHYMHSMFSYLARGTVAENADLVVQRTPFTVKCNQCGQVFHLDTRAPKDTWKCPKCQAERDYKLNSGMEFRIDTIDVLLTEKAAS